jgi:hypothetical protein
MLSRNIAKFFKKVLSDLRDTDESSEIGANKTQNIKM